MMKKFSALITLTLLCWHPLPLNAQWSHFCAFDISSAFYSWFSDADFITADTGAYAFSYWISPSSGGGFIVKNTFIGAGPWTTTFEFGGNSVECISIKTFRAKKTFYLIYANGYGTSLEKSADGGVTWSFIGSVSSEYYDFSAPDTSRLFALFYYNHCLLARYDHGVWNPFFHTFSSWLTGEGSKIFFVDTITGFITVPDTITGMLNAIIKSTDGGSNWSEVLYDTSIRIRNLYFTSLNTGFAVGESGKIIKTADGGTTWLHLNSGTSINLNAVCFLNDTLGFACGDSGVIIRTVNGGTSWTTDNTGTTAPFLKIFFVNDSIGYALIDSHLYKTNLNQSTSVWEKGESRLAGVKLFPNPADHDLFISTSPGSSISEINLYSITGQRVLQVKGPKYQIDVSGLRSGIYIAEVVINGLINWEKLVIL
jgi:photosystem II stability/assembly factor-like uncharacterized protein